MDIVMKIGGTAVLGTVLILAVRREAPEQALLLALACGAVVLSLLTEPLREALRAWDRLAAQLPAAGRIAPTLLKLTGISVTARFAAELCRDGGQGALAAKVEMAGLTACMAVMLPLAEETLALIASML